MRKSAGFSSSPEVEHTGTGGTVEMVETEGKERDRRRLPGSRLSHCVSVRMLFTHPCCGLQESLHGGLHHEDRDGLLTQA